jgi:acetyltransferase EpsM
VFFIIGIGHAKFSQKVCRELADLGVENWISVVHPTAFISSKATVGKGVYIGANTTLSINAHVNNHSIINQNCSIGHDVTIGKHSIISSGCILSGRVEVGNEVFMGSEVVIIPLIRVGDNIIIGANTLVTKQIPSNHQVMSVVRIVTMPIE